MGVMVKELVSRTVEWLGMRRERKRDMLIVYVLCTWSKWFTLMCVLFFFLYANVYELLP